MGALDTSALGIELNGDFADCVSELVKREGPKRAAEILLSNLEIESNAESDLEAEGEEEDNEHEEEEDDEENDDMRGEDEDVAAEEGEEEEEDYGENDNLVLD